MNKYYGKNHRILFNDNFVSVLGAPKLGLLRSSYEYCSGNTGMNSIRKSHSFFLASLNKHLLMFHHLTKPLSLRYKHTCTEGQTCQQIQ